MGKGFAIDTSKAQQMADRLTSIGRGIERIPRSPQPRGPLGSGVIEQAWSQFESAVATARQNLTQSINESADGFAALARGVTNVDQQQAQEAETI